MGNDNNVGGLKRNSLILNKWWFESFIHKKLWGFKRNPPIPHIWGIIYHLHVWAWILHSFHVGDLERYPHGLVNIVSRQKLLTSKIVLVGPFSWRFIFSPIVILSIWAIIIRSPHVLHGGLRKKILTLNIWGVTEKSPIFYITTCDLEIDPPILHMCVSYK